MPEDSSRREPVARDAACLQMTRIPSPGRPAPRRGSHTLDPMTMKCMRLFAGLRTSLRWMCLAAILPITACGDPAEGTIKMPPRSELTPDATGGGAGTPKKSSRRDVELKTIGPGAKKF